MCKTCTEAAHPVQVENKTRTLTKSWGWVELRVGVGFEREP